MWKLDIEESMKNSRKNGIVKFVLVDAHPYLWCQTAEEWGNPVYIQSVRKKVPLRDLSLSLTSLTPISPELL